MRTCCDQNKLFVSDSSSINVLFCAIASLTLTFSPSPYPHLFTSPFFHITRSQSLSSERAIQPLVSALLHIFFMLFSNLGTHLYHWWKVLPFLELRLTVKQCCKNRFCGWTCCCHQSLLKHFYFLRQKQTEILHRHTFILLHKLFFVSLLFCSHTHFLDQQIFQYYHLLYCISTAILACFLFYLLICNMFVFDFPSVSTTSFFVLPAHRHLCCVVDYQMSTKCSHMFDLIKEKPSDQLRLNWQMFPKGNWEKVKVNIADTLSTTPWSTTFLLVLFCFLYLFSFSFFTSYLFSFGFVHRNTPTHLSPTVNLIDPQ